jgi:vancomycin aglycone glucosyltransferase
MGGRENARAVVDVQTALSPQTRTRAAAVAAAIRTDGATVAAQLLADTISRQGLPA